MLRLSQVSDATTLPLHPLKSNVFLLWRLHRPTLDHHSSHLNPWLQTSLLSLMLPLQSCLRRVHHQGLRWLLAWKSLRLA